MTVEKDSTEEKDSDILENEDDKDLDELLNGKPEEDEKPENKKTETEKEGDGEKTYKLGNKEFTTFEEFNDAVQDMHKRNGNFASKLSELGIDPKTMTAKQKKEVEKAIADDKKEDAKKEFDEQDYYKFEAIKFQKAFPSSKEYKEEINILIKKDNCKIDGEPSYALAFARALVANGQNIPDNLAARIRLERGDLSEGGNKSSVKTQKRIMSAGGTSSEGYIEQESYQSQEEIDSISDFAKSL